MKSKKIIFVIALLILTSLILSACTSSVYGSTSWHGLTLGPASAPDTAYLAAGGQVYAIDLNAGTQKWKFPQSANRAGFYASPVLSDDGTQLLVPSYDHTLYSVNPVTGAQIWQSKSLNNRLIARPLIIGSTVYQPSADGNVYAINLNNGSLVWTNPATTGRDPLWAQPVTFAGCNCFYIAAMNHMVYKFDANTGQQISVSTDLKGSIVGTPAVGPDGTLYVGTFANQLIALDGGNLTVKWRYDTKNWVWAGPTLDNGTLYFGDLSGNLYAVNATDHSLLWSAQPKNSIVDTPAVLGDKIYVTTESDTLYIVNTADGKVSDSTVVGGVIYTSPRLTSDKVLIAPTGYGSNLLVALNIQNIHAAPMWTPFVPPK